MVVHILHNGAQGAVLCLWTLGSSVLAVASNIIFISEVVITLANGLVGRRPQYSECFFSEYGWGLP